MSEEKQTAEVEIIPLDAVISLKVGGSFVARLSAFITDFFPYKDKEHFTEIIKNIKENTNQDDPYVFHLFTLLSLQKHIELEAKEQNQTKKVLVDLNTGQPIEEENQPAPQNQEQPVSQDSTPPLNNQQTT